MPDRTLNWDKPTPSQYQSSAVQIDADADWYWKKNAGAGQKLSVLIGLRAGVSPRQLMRPPRAAAREISPELWAQNLTLTPFYVESAQSESLSIGGYCTGLATRRFFEWLHAMPALQSLIESLTLSRGPQTVPAAVARAKPGGGSHKKAKYAKVVLGVIDDWIGLANQRFQEPSGETRFLAAWLQGFNGAGPSGFTYGSEFTDQDIDANFIASKGNEELFEFNLHDAQKYRPSTRLTHGTHVADLFAGYAISPSSEAQLGRERPIIGVMLPPDDVANTSGLSLVVPVIDAVHYILDVLRPQGGAPRVTTGKNQDAPPVVINLSYGWYGAAHDGSSTLEKALTSIMANYNALHPQAPLVIVTSAGNSLQSQGHVVLPRQGGSGAAAWTTMLRVLPDDRTPSLIKFFLAPQAAQFSLAVTAPGISGSAMVDASNPSIALLDASGQTVAQLLYVAPTTLQPSGSIALTLQPTAEAWTGANSIALAPHGIWTLTIGGASATPGTVVHGWIARDDTSAGSGSGGRQARFEDVSYQRTGPFGALLEADAPGTVSRRQGAINAIATGVDAGPVSVAGCLAGATKPSPYSGSGFGGTSQWPSVRGPDAICDADQSPILSGLMAAGTRSGSIVAMNGTSVAAPIAARAIADMLASSPVSPPSLAANAGRAIAYKLASGSNAPPPVMPPDLRKGHGHITTSGSRNLRLKALRMK